MTETPSCRICNGRRLFLGMGYDMNFGWQSQWYPCPECNPEPPLTRTEKLVFGALTIAFLITVGAVMKWAAR